MIGIIAMLMGILLPAMSAARGQAKAVACTSNLRQLATAALMYAQDKKLYVSFVPAIGSTPAKDRKELLYPYLRQGRNNADNDANQAWHCPANDRVAVQASYGFNTNLNGVRLNRIRNWSQTVALCDAGLLDQPAGAPSLATHCWPPSRPATASSCRPDHQRHPRQTVGVGFVDGHAERLPMRPPFYPGPIGTYIPNGITNVYDINYQDQLWDLQ